MSLRYCAPLHLRFACFAFAWLLLALAIASPARAAVCRVSPGGTGDGSSWASPINIRWVLLIGGNYPNCTEIWVKQGTYTPSDRRDDPLNSFYIGPDVLVYGGFAGTETQRNQRNPALNITTLSGELGNPGPEDNSYHVVTIDGTTNAGPVTATTVLDGFTISGGNADGSTAPDIFGGGLLCRGAGIGNACSPSLSNLTFSNNRTIGNGSGGALFNDGYSGTSSPTLSNVTFNGNSSGFGGAIYNNGGSGGNSSPILSNVTFSDNSAVLDANGNGGYGGAMYSNGRNAGISNPSLSNVSFIGNIAADSGGAMDNDGSSSGTSNPALNGVTFSSNSAGFGGAIFNDGSVSGTSSPTVSSVTFNGNSADYGGAIFNNGYTGTSSPQLSNVTFSGNSATLGGAMYNNGDTGASNPSLINVTFSTNSATASGGAVVNDASNAGISSPFLSNVIAWGDTAITSGAEIYNLAPAAGDIAVPSIDHSVIQGSGGSGNWDANLGTDLGNNLDADPVLGVLANHGGATSTLVPGADGSAINAGNDTTCNGAIVHKLDQRGVKRPQGVHCDIGAIEFRPSDDDVFIDGFDV